MENKETVTLRKIPLKVLLDVLTNLWNGGADYVDIVGILDEVQDNIGIITHEEYFSKEEDDEEELDREVELDPKKPLKDDDLDELI